MKVKEKAGMTKGKEECKRGKDKKEKKKKNDSKHDIKGLVCKVRNDGKQHQNSVCLEQ